MSFRFNFPHPTAETSDSCCEKSSQNSINNCEESLSSVCGLISVTDVHLKHKNENVTEIKIGDFIVKYNVIKSLQEKTEDETLLLLDDLQTDILPGRYEGGLKIWECSLDLAHFLGRNNCIKEGDSVLELGCGAGLPGIVAYLSGASVIFQDFNSEVLELVTIPNVLLNSPSEKHHFIAKTCQFLYGDWGAINKSFFSDFLKNNFRFDVIITSETIYDKSSQGKLLNLMKCALKPDGVIYLASKVHYFGVGGGIIEFESLVNQDGTFELSTISRITDGVERQILMLKNKNSSIS